MAVLVFVDFETFGTPGAPELVWQFAYGLVDTSQQSYWNKIDYFAGLIDWSNLDFNVLSPSSRDFTMKYTPHAFDWVTGKVESEYELFTRKQFSQATIEWFHSHGCYPGGENQFWSMVGRNPKFDYYCFPEVVRKHIGLDPFKCEDFALMYAALARNTTSNLPSMDSIKKATNREDLTHHDALLDIKDEIFLTLEAWSGVNRYFANKQST